MARNVLIAALLACASIGLLTPAARSDAQGSRTYQIDIPRMPLGKAIKAVLDRADLQYLYKPSSEAEESTIVGPLNGEYTIDAALVELLEPVGLRYEWSNDRTINFLPPEPSARPNAGGVVAETKRAKDRQYSALDPNQRRSMTAGGAPSGSAIGPDMVDTVIVTGSRLGQNSETNPSLTVFTESQLDELGISSLADLMKYLPQQPYVRYEGYRFDGAQFAELRGLGFDTTVLLIDGRRVLPSAASLTINAFDLNSIPLPAVERVEVLADSASAVYGADAIGGVINVILKKDVSHPKLDLNYGAAAGGADERRASFSIGDPTGRLRGSFVLDYFQRDPLLGEARERWRDQDFRRFGSLDRRLPIANPGNVVSLTSSSLPGLPVRFAAVPAGSSGIGLTAADFSSTGGTRNLESWQRFWSIVPEAERHSAVAQVELDVTGRTTAFADFLHFDGTNMFQREPPSLPGMIVPAANAFNPFDTPVAVIVLLTGIGPRPIAYESQLSRATGGLRGTLSRWDWELAVLRSEDDADAQLEKDIDFARLNAALSSSDPAIAFNPFQDGPGASPELLASLVAEPLTSHYSADGTQASAYLRGPLFTTPAGQASAVLGGEWREERMGYDIGPLLGGPAVVGSHRRTVSATFAEVQLPLVSSSAHVPLVNDLVLALAARRDDYSDMGDSFNPQYTVIWRPIADVSLRASYATSFRPPSLFDLFAQSFSTVVPIPDSRRGNEVAPVRVIGGGNSDLDPTRAQSVNVGILIAPRSLRDLRIAASYWQIGVDDRVGVPSVDIQLASEAVFADRIVRAAPSSQDLAAGLAGRLVQVDVSRLNFGSIDTSGIDLNACYTWDTKFGHFSPGLSATWVHDFRTVDLPGTATTDRVAIAHPLGTIPRWRAVASLGWKWRGMGLLTTLRYVPSYDDATFTSGRIGRRVRAQTLLDAQASLDFDGLIGRGSAWRGLEIRAGVSNLFDEDPPFAEVGSASGYDLSQGDLKQRFSYIKISKSF